MRISIFGLGYVGAVTGACLAKAGHIVVGVDPDRRKIEFIRQGKSPIVEEGLQELISEGVAAERFCATDDFLKAVAETEASLICVGTPSLPNGSLRTDYLENVAREIGRSLREKVEHHSVVVRSTVLPGTTEGLLKPILEEESGKKEGEGFGLSMNPEFLREGVSVRDFGNPPMTVIGTESQEEFERISSIYGSVSGEFIHCRISTAEAIKYGCNIFHALKITFANEMGMLCKRLGVDSNEVLNIICQDKKLNISDKYLRPGFAFGGSCLPKDLRAYTHKARTEDVALPVFEAVMASNRMQIERTADRIMAVGSKKVALLGVSFKEGTDDLRESPLVALAEILIGRGYDLKIYDPNVEYASLYGSNKEFIDRELPHLKRILVGADEALAHADVLIFGHDAPAYRELVPKVLERHKVLDLVRIADRGDFRGHYDGLYW
ncbi:MAG: UDP-glucose/GDP-mannose dehydrogenase family protein [Armatimonadetes bacterium]|nr:UDP-glucose/GDP-mannose dehydrogenase family protein [Armatimonadota bacterium]